MKILLDFKTGNATQILKVLRSLPYEVKAKLLTDEKAELMLDIRKAVEELKLVRKGKLKARNVEDLINEL